MIFSCRVVVHSLVSCCVRMRHVVFYVLLGKVALPALTRVTRLDSNFDPVPGSTVPRIAPSLLVTYAHHDEEVHVALPPVKTNNSHSNSSHYGVINPAGRTQYQHISQRPAHYQQQQQQQQQSDNERSSSDGLRRRGVPCRGINNKFSEFAFLSSIIHVLYTIRQNLEKGIAKVGSFGVARREDSLPDHDGRDASLF